MGKAACWHLNKYATLSLFQVKLKKKTIKNAYVIANGCKGIYTENEFVGTFSVIQALKKILRSSKMILLPTPIEA